MGASGPPPVGYRLLESSSDIILEADGPDPGAALVEAARGFSHVTTKASAIGSSVTSEINIAAGGDLARLAATFVNQLVFLFSIEGFLPSGGTLQVDSQKDSHRVRGTLTGETYDRAKHRLGTEVKAATLHEAEFGRHGDGYRVRLLLDL